MTLFKPRVGKVIFAQTTGGLSVIIPFHFNTSQVNLVSNWALNWPWALDFEYHWGTGVQVVRGTKCGVYTYTKTIGGLVW